MLVAFLTQATMAQDVKKVKDLLAANKLVEAKTMIDQMIVKGKVYSALAMSPTDRDANPEARMTSLDAFKKSQELDKNTFTLYSTTDGYMPIFNLYTSGFEAGANLYNTEKYEEALATFKNTGTVGEYIFSQGWGLYKLDTMPKKKMKQ
jgi:hypothetical protein